MALAIEHRAYEQGVVTASFGLLAVADNVRFNTAELYH